MPVVFRYKGYRFFFFSNEGDPLEPMHIHVRRGEATAKLWMLPQVLQGRKIMGGERSPADAATHAMDVKPATRPLP